MDHKIVPLNPPFKIIRDPRWTQTYWDYVCRLDAAARVMNCWVPVR